MAQPKRKERSLSAVEGTGDAAEPVEPWTRPQGLTRRGWYILGGVLLLVNVPLLHMWLKSAPEANVTLPYTDDFSNRETLKKNYFSTGGLWRVSPDGQLLSPGVKNNPLWLKAKLPRDVAIEFDAHCESPDAEIRVEVFGNGVDHLSGYELVQGAYNNTRSIIGRLDDRLSDENGRSLSLGEVQRRGQILRADTHVVVEANPFPTQPHVTYHWRIERRGNALRWSINGQPFMQFEDPHPLEGPGHDRFGPSSWDTDTYFDNLHVEALDSRSASAPFPTAPASAATSTPLSPPPVTGGGAAGFQDNFDRSELGADWLATDPNAVKLGDGSALVQNGHNHPVWLRRPLPDNALIDFETWTDSPVGDMKVEVWGDGHSFHQGDLRAAYTSTGYVFVFGGWNNTISAIAKQHEHGPDRQARDDVKVEPGRHYHWRIVRRGTQIGWMLDGKPFLGINDPAPLTGPDHQYFALGNWESPVHFDNLVIQPLPAG